jgi:hypothetical protein
MPNIEYEFQRLIHDTRYICKPSDGCIHNSYYDYFCNPLTKFTLELIYDGYNHLIPPRYIRPENRLLIYYGKMFYRIALTGNLDMIMLLLKPDNKENVNHVMAGAAKGGHLHILQWMLAVGYKFNVWAPSFAIKGNRTDIFDWLVENDCDYLDVRDVDPNDDHLHDDCLGAAAKMGNVKILKWLV